MSFGVAKRDSCYSNLAYCGKTRQTRQTRQIHHRHQAGKRDLAGRRHHYFHPQASSRPPRLRFARLEPRVVELGNRHFRHLSRGMHFHGRCSDVVEGAYRCRRRPGCRRCRCSRRWRRLTVVVPLPLMVRVGPVAGSSDRYTLPDSRSGEAPLTVRVWPAPELVTSPVMTRALPELLARSGCYQGPRACRFRRWFRSWR